MTCKLPTKKGESKKIRAHGKTLIVRRIPNRKWILRVEGQQSRARFADRKADACEDIAYFKETGVLPRGKAWPPF